MSKIIESSKIIRSESRGHVLEFDEIKHRYILNGKRVPGATTFCKGGYPTSEALVGWMVKQGAEYTYDTLIEESTHEGSFIEWPDSDRRTEILKAAKGASKKKAEEAAAIGTLVHDYAYHIETIGAAPNELLEVIAIHTDKDKILNGIDKFKVWKTENSDEMVASEAIVASVCHNFGGKFDRLARRDGKLILSDFKTSNAIYLDHFIQAAAYAIAIKEWRNLEVEGLEILRFGKENGEFQTLLIDDLTEIREFQEQAIRCRDTYEFRKWEQDKRFKWGGK